ncbi:MAG: hypothetical protein ACMUIM_07275 [bacterium]
MTQGADVNNPNAFGISPFMGFCAYGDLELVKLALFHGAKINESYLQLTGNAEGKKNWTPLQSSATFIFTNSKLKQLSISCPIE